MKNVSEDKSGAETPNLGRKILIVEPDSALAEFLKVQLQTNGGFCPIIAANSQEALNLVKAEGIDAILAGQKLDTGNCFEFAFQVRKEHATKPEIIVLANDPKISLFEAHQVGVGHILQKPVNLEELTNVLKKVTGEKRRFERINVANTVHGPLKGDVSINDVSSSNLDIEISDIGRGGFFYAVQLDSELPPVGQIVDFKIKLGMLPNHHFAGRGIVRWVKRTNKVTGAGIEFLLIPEESERLIAAFVDLFKVKPFVPGQSERN